MRLSIVVIAFFGASLAAVNAAAQGLCSPDPGAASTAAASTQTTKLTLWERLTKRIELRQNTNVKKDIAQPAFVAFTNPDDGPTTYQVGVGVLADVCPGTGFDVDALLDYQRNTAVDEEQDSFKLGATGYWRLGDLASKHHAAQIHARTNFKNDGVKDSKGWQTSVGYTHLFSGTHAWPLPNHFFPIGSASGNRTAWLEVIYFPYLGLEFDSVLGAPTEEVKGTATRTVLQLSVGVYPLPLKTRSPVEVLIGYTYRGDLKDTTNQIDDSHPLFTFEANYFLYQDKQKGEIGFGVSYTNGEDPDESFESQAFWQFTLKFRLKKPP